MAAELLVLFLLLLANGFLALAEIAVVSARRTRLAERARRGEQGAAAALALVASPTRFLSTVQVGITLIGILSGAYGGATIARELAVLFAAYPALAPYGDQLGVAIVVAAITYCSVVIGEIVPKRVALSNPDRYAALAARPMNVLSRIAAPAVAALEFTSDLVVRLFRLPKGVDSSVTEADVSAMVAAGTAAGVFEPAERRIVERVFRLDDEPVAALMTPRRDIVWLDANDPPEAHDELMRAHPYCCFPVCDGSLERVLGVMDVRDVWIAEREAPERRLPELRALVRQPLFVPDRVTALAVLQQFQTTGTKVAIVIDEHGAVDGLLTLHNVLMFLIASPDTALSRADDAPIVQRAPDSWLVDGAISTGEFYAGIGMEAPEGRKPAAYHTVAGLVMTHLGRIPAPGDRVELGPLVFEVADMDGFRVDKVLVTRHGGNAASTGNP